MSLVTTTAFILRVDPLSEKDLVAALLTKDHGVVRGAVKGARGPSRRRAALETLTEVSVTYFRRESADLARVDRVEVLRSAFALAQQAATAMLLPYVAESALTFVPEQEPGTEVYRLVRHVLDALEAGIDPDVSARYFEAWLLRFAGLLPEDGTCVSCGEAVPPGAARLDPHVPGLGHVECVPASRGIPVPASSRALLAALRRRPLPQVAADGGGPGREGLEGVETLCREVRRRFLGHELKSYRFLDSLS